MIDSQGQVNRPIPCPEAFRIRDGEAAQSRAAFLLSLGIRMRGDDREDLDGLRDEVLPEKDLTQFPVPKVPATVNRFAPRKVQESIKQDEYQLAKTLFDDPRPLLAVQLMELALHDANELVRVAAAASYFGFTTDPTRPLQILEAGCRSEDGLVRAVAATALANVFPESPALQPLTERGTPRGGEEKSRTALLVHGTWARGNSWWQPGGTFHAYILASVWPDLYSASDRFDWTGGYSDAARALGALDLTQWITSRGFQGLNLMAHSHGGSVSMLTTQAGVPMNKLILLSCPVHRTKYWPNFSVVSTVVSVRVHLDLVILADGGGQRFRDPQIRENVLPLWFNHSASHDPAVWVAHNVPSMI